MDHRSRLDHHTETLASQTSASDRRSRLDPRTEISPRFSNQWPQISFRPPHRKLSLLKPVTHSLVYDPAQKALASQTIVSDHRFRLYHRTESSASQTVTTDHRLDPPHRNLSLLKPVRTESSLLNSQWPQISFRPRTESSRFSTSDHRSRLDHRTESSRFSNQCQWPQISFRPPHRKLSLLRPVPVTTDLV